MTGVILAAVATVIMGIAGIFLVRRTQCDIPTQALMWLNFTLPFAFGGFFTYMSLPLTVFLLAVLWLTVKKNGKLHFKFNLSTLAVSLVVLGYLVTGAAQEIVKNQ